MHALRRLPLVVVVCSVVGTASAQEQGDRIVTIIDASLRSQDSTTVSVPKGAILVVTKRDGNHLWVTWSDKTGTIEGRLDRSNVVPFSQALDFFRKELERSPTARAYAIRGKMRSETHDHDKAIADWTEAIRLDPKQQATYVERGSAFLDKKEYDNAIADYNEAIRLDPKSGAAYGNRGNAWWAKEEYGKAMSDYVEAMELDPQHAFDFIHRGDASKTKAESDKAHADYNLAIQIGPQNATLLIIRNPLLVPKTIFDKGIAQYNEAIRLNPTNATTHIIRARILAGQVEYERAIADYDEARRLDPKNLEPWNAEAWIAATCLQTRFRDGKKAVHYATKACELTDWKDARVLDTLAAAYAEDGDFENAVKWEGKALKLLPRATDDMGRMSEHDFRFRLDLFKAHKPYHDEAKK